MVGDIFCFSLISQEYKMIFSVKNSRTMYKFIPSLKVTIFLLIVEGTEMIKLVMKLIFVPKINIWEGKG